MAVRSAQMFMTISVVALNARQLHVEVRHRDRPIPAPDCADSGRRGPTVCTRHAVVLATSTGRQEVALYALEPPFRVRRAAAFTTELQLVEHVAW